LGCVILCEFSIFPVDELGYLRGIEQSDPDVFLFQTFEQINLLLISLFKLVFLLEACPILHVQDIDLLLDLESEV
jgi:hypothetical protein